MKPGQLDILVIAQAAGCKPRWYDGLIGWAWHCTCPDNDHGFDQQCSAITEESAVRAAVRSAKARDEWERNARGARPTRDR
jgi:hypothetical protein